MDYKQKYEEALERARDLHDNHPLGQPLTWTTCEKIFPELRESEDEKIRNRLIEFISCNPGVISDLDEEKALDWLEKQELKSNPYSGVSFNYNGNTWGMCAREGGVDILCDSQLIKHIEKQGENKPIEQDIENRDLWEYIKEWKDKFGRLPKDEDELAVCIDYVIKRQKPTVKIKYKSTWSEEDNKNLNSVKWIIENSENLNRVFETIDSPEYIKKYFIDWLNSLKDRVQPQPKQEWCEENEKIINDAIWLIEHYATEGNKKLLREQTIDNLKSIKSKKHWKPSEEHFRALFFAIEYFKKKKNDTKYLKSLYDGLKNL